MPELRVTISFAVTSNASGLAAISAFAPVEALVDQFKEHIHQLGADSVLVDSALVNPRKRGAQATLLLEAPARPAPPGSPDAAGPSHNPGGDHVNEPKGDPGAGSAQPILTGHEPAPPAPPDDPLDIPPGLDRRKRGERLEAIRERIGKHEPTESDGPF